MHTWGDDWFKEHGAKLGETITYCTHVWRRYGRIGAHTKEKYGTFRDGMTCGLWDGGIHTLIWPGYVWIKVPFLYFKVDRYVVRPFTKYTGLHKLGVLWQKTVYNYAIQKMCKKYPEITDEIVSDLDGYEMVTPGIFGKVCGKTIHGKYWVTL